MTKAFVELDDAFRHTIQYLQSPHFMQKKGHCSSIIQLWQRDVPRLWPAAANMGHICCKRTKTLNDKNLNELLNAVPASLTGEQKKKAEACKTAKS